jgi:parallel beta-helix repeat protein
LLSYTRLFLLLAAAAGYARAAGRQIDIRSTGAACDGSTDDAAAVQRAVNRLAPGDTLLVSCRAAIGKAGILIRDRREITIRGIKGGGFKALAPTSLASQGFSPVMILLTGCRRCTVESLDLDMNGVGEAGLGMDRCEESAFRQNTVSNTGYPANAAIVATGNRRATYAGNRVLRTGADAKDGTRGMWIGNGDDRQEEWGPEVSGNVVQQAGATGIVVYARGAVIQENSVSQTKGAGLKLIARPVAGMPQPQTKILHNTLTGNLFHGLQIERGEGGVMIESNTFDSNAVAGIYVFGGDFTGQIVGNTFTGNREAGIYLYTASGVAIRNNRFAAGSPAEGHGILLEVLPGHSVRNLEILGNSIWDQQWDGLAIRARGGDLAALRIHSNSIGGHSPVGLRLEDESGRAAGQISLDANCFDRQLGHTVNAPRAAALNVPAGNCKPAGDSSVATKGGRP